jgi:two-component system OmpR family response regulator
MTYPTVLIVDDDDEITHLLGNYLVRYQLQAVTACDGPSMWRQLAQHAVDLVVLDVMLPGADGLTLARQIRERAPLPIIMLTARGDMVDRVMGLEIGADDYVTKPFEPRELVARIQSVLRRTGAANPAALADDASGQICFDHWVLYKEERLLQSPQGVKLSLSNAEYRLLCVFLRSPRHLLSREQLMEQARGRSLDMFDRSMDVLVSRLRQKLSQDGDAPSLIKTVRGAGYMLTAQTVRARRAWPTP